MYHPDTNIDAPQAYNLMEFSEVFINTQAHQRLALWQHPAAPSMPTIVFFHGNAGNLSNRRTIFHALAEQGFGVVAVDYRGFGKSEGSPTEAGVYEDAAATIDYTKNTLHIPQQKLIYFGESLGTGVAIEMAKHSPPALLMLEAPYTSVATLAAETYWFIAGATYVVWDRYDAVDNIPSLHCPILMIHGEEDSIIPVKYARTLFAAANEPKKLIIYPGREHVSFTMPEVITPLLEMSKNYGLVGK